MSAEQRQLAANSEPGIIDHHGDSFNARRRIHVAQRRIHAARTRIRCPCSRIRENSQAVDVVVNASQVPRSDELAYRTSLRVDLLPTRAVDELRPHAGNEACSDRS